MEEKRRKIKERVEENTARMKETGGEELDWRIVEDSVFLEKMRKDEEKETWGEMKKAEGNEIVEYK